MAEDLKRRCITEDPTGKRFGSRVATGKYKYGKHKDGSSKLMWEVVCDCGNVDWKEHRVLRRTKLCVDCAYRKSSEKRHGHQAKDCTALEKSTYNIWRGMKDRCCNKKHPAYADYGGRGIQVCDRWLHAYENFLEDMGVHPEGLEIDRIDNNKGYSPDNCRWATKTENARNTRANLMLTFKGETLCLTEWASRSGLHPSTIKHRLARGWDLEAALTKKLSAPQKYKYDGKELDLKGWAAETGIAVETLWNRLYKGWSLEEALTIPVSDGKGDYYTHAGKTKTIREWSEDTGIGYKTLFNRIGKGWPIEKVLTTPVRGHNKKEKKSDGN